MSLHRNNENKARGLVLWAILPGLIALTGCRSPMSVLSSPNTQTDRLMEAYQDLQGGRFVVIADFEQKNHMELVGLSGDSGQNAAALDRRRLENAGRRRHPT